MELCELIKQAHKNAVNKGFWDLENKTLKAMIYDPKYSISAIAVVGDAFISQRLMLIVSEVSEALEALRKKDKSNFEEEIADVAIRLADLCGGMDIDLEAEIQKKMEKNKNRPYKHGKEF